MVLLNTVHIWSFIGVGTVGVADHFRVVTALLTLEAWAAKWEECDITIEEMLPLSRAFALTSFTYTKPTQEKMSD